MLVFPQTHLRGLHPAKGEFSTRRQEKQGKKAEDEIRKTEDGRQSVARCGRIYAALRDTEGLTAGELENYVGRFGPGGPN